MAPTTDANFKQNYQTHLKYLKLMGLQPKTTKAYSLAVRRIDTYFLMRRVSVSMSAIPRATKTVGFVAGRDAYAAAPFSGGAPQSRLLFPNRLPLSLDHPKPWGPMTPPTLIVDSASHGLHLCFI